MMGGTLNWFKGAGDTEEQQDNQDQPGHEGAIGLPFFGHGSVDLHRVSSI